MTEHKAIIFVVVLFAIVLLVSIRFKAEAENSKYRAGDRLFCRTGTDKDKIEELTIERIDGGVIKFKERNYLQLLKDCPIVQKATLAESNR